MYIYNIICLRFIKRCRIVLRTNYSGCSNKLAALVWSELSYLLILTLGSLIYIGSITIFMQFANRWGNLVIIQLCQYSEHCKLLFLCIFFSSVNNNIFPPKICRSLCLNKCVWGEFFFINLIWRKLQPKSPYFGGSLWWTCSSWAYERFKSCDFGLRHKELGIKNWRDPFLVIKSTNC